ncbi:MAG: hypothetical protein RLZZ612_1785 [Pseudomonadota bacterium]|jgi:molecular chaperone HscB
MNASVPSLQASDFELFGLPERFALDAATLDTQWKRLLRETHPDRFTTDAAASQRIAMQWAVRINEAYQRLKHPIRRAAYLCERRGAAIQAHSNTQMPTAFLMQQMAWREALDEAQHVDELERLLDEAQAARRQHLKDVACALDEQADQPAALQQAVVDVRALMFIERFSSEVSDRLAALED